MKIISFDKIKKLNIEPITCYECVSDMIAIKKEALLPAKISMKPDLYGVFYNLMQAIIPSVKSGG